MLSFVEINDSFTVSSSLDSATFAPDIDAQVDALWSRAVEMQPGLFDGTILRVYSSDAQGMRCVPISYRYFYAQQKDRQLQQALRLVAVGVSGLVTLEDKVLVGTRSASVTQCPNLFELVPSGSLPAPDQPTDSLDYRRQLLTELREESGIEENNIDRCEPFLLVTDETDAVVDICCAIALKNLKVTEVLDSLRSDEYTDMEFVPRQQLFSMVKTAPELWVSASALMIARLETRH